MSMHSSTSGSMPQPSSSLPSIYDTYLCKEPTNDLSILNQNGPDEYTARMRSLQRSVKYFTERSQVRAVEALQFEMAKVHMQHDQWERAARVLMPLWQTLSWKRSGWFRLVSELDWALRDCASKTKDLETLIAVELELMDKCKWASITHGHTLPDLSQP